MSHDLLTSYTLVPKKGRPVLFELLVELGLLIPLSRLLNCPHYLQSLATAKAFICGAKHKKPRLEV